MNCEQCQQLLLDYAYGELSAAQQADFLAALERCPECKQELARIQRVRQGVQAAAPSREVPALLHANVMRQARLHADQLQAQQAGFWERASSVLFHPAFASATALVALFAVGVTFFDLGQGEPRATQAEHAPALAEAPAPTAAAPAAEAKGEGALGAEGGALALQDGDKEAEADDAKQADKADEPLGGSLDGQVVSAREEAKPVPQEPAWARGKAAGGPEAARQERAPAPPSGAADLGEPKKDATYDDKLPNAEEAKVVAPSAPSQDPSPTLRPKDDAMNAGASRNAYSSGSASDGDGLAVAGAGTNELEGRAGFGGSAGGEARAGDAYTTKQSAAPGVWSEDNAPQQQGQDAGAQPAEVEQRYSSGMSRYNRGDFAGAVEDFNAYIREAPRSSNYYALALYHRGRSEMNQGNPRAAAASFRKVLQEFPNSEKQPEARYWLAKSLLQVNPQDAEGLAILDELSQGNSSVAADARRDSQAYGRRDAQKRAKERDAAPSKKAKSADEKYDKYEMPVEQQQNNTVE